MNENDEVLKFEVVEVIIKPIYTNKSLPMLVGALVSAIILMIMVKINL